jgi:hypothetical protein
MKLPRLAKKLRVMASWTLDLFFGQEIEQTISVSDVEAFSAQLARVRARIKLARSTSAASVLANSGHDQAK